MADLTPIPTNYAGVTFRTNSILEPQMTNTEMFLIALFGKKPQGHLIHLFTAKGDTSRSHFCADIDEAVKTCTGYKGFNIWAGCGTRLVDHGPKRGGYIDVVGIPGLWMDIDIASDAHKKNNLPPTVEAALDVLNILGMPPTLVVHSGHGLQGWWLFEKFLEFKSEATRARAQELTKAFHDAIIAATPYKDIDNVTDLARIMRVPRTMNIKPGHEPVEAYTYIEDGPFYKLSEFKGYIPKDKPVAATPAKVSSAPATTKWDPETKTRKATLEQLQDPRYWLDRAMDKTIDGTRHNHGWWLATMLRDNCIAPGLISLAEGESVFRQFANSVDDNPADPYGKSEINSALDILAEPGREPSWKAKLTARIIHTGFVGKRANQIEPEAAADLNNVLSKLAMTDVGNMERLLSRYGEDIYYCTEFGKWFVWDGNKWGVDNSGTITQLGIATVRAILDECETIKVTVNKDEKNPKDDYKTILEKHARRSEAITKIGAMISLAQAYKNISAEELDSDPWLLGCKNGTLDLKTGELLEPQRHNLITRNTGCNFNPEAKCPQWLTFVDWMFQGNTELVEYMQRAFGYSLTGVIREQCLFFLHGIGSNGKSTMLGVMEAVLGDYACNTPADTLLVKDHQGISNDIARLKGARMVTAIEADEGKRMAESLIKSLTGGDTISARFMRQEFFSFKSSFKLFLAANSKPGIRGTDEGIWRRIKLIPFDAAVADADRDDDLQLKLLEEAEGILAWAMRGCINWQKHKLGKPAAITAATAEYRAEEDHLAPFISDKCLVHPDLSVRAAELYAAYMKYCDDVGDKWNYSQTKFGTKMKTRPGIHKEHDRLGWTYYGIDLRINHTLVDQAGYDNQQAVTQPITDLPENILGETSEQPVTTRRANSDNPSQEISGESSSLPSVMSCDEFVQFHPMNIIKEGNIGDMKIHGETMRKPIISHHNPSQSTGLSSENCDGLGNTTKPITEYDDSMFMEEEI